MSKKYLLTIIIAFLLAFSVNEAKAVLVAEPQDIINMDVSAIKPGPGDTMILDMPKGPLSFHVPKQMKREIIHKISKCGHGVKIIINKRQKSITSAACLENSEKKFK